MRASIAPQFMARLLNRLVPPHCPICDAPLLFDGLCGACWTKICFITAPYCARCGRPLPAAMSPDQICGACMTNPPLIRRMRSAVRYDDASKDLILPFKHASRLDLTNLIAVMMQSHFNALISDETVIMPIPLHFSRRLYRRYNQSAELARQLAKAAHRDRQLDFTSLYRRKATRPLARHSKSKRRNILTGAFALRDHGYAAIKDRPILLIDDVLTTGQTAHHVTALLQKSGARHVDLLTCAKVI